MKAEKEYIPRESMFGNASANVLGQGMRVKSAKLKASNKRQGRA